MSKPAPLLGGILLIAGSCIGAGMLGLPVQTGLSGFLYSLAAFLLVWVFMTLNGFYLIEVSSWHSKQSNLLSLISAYLGSFGRYIGWIFYLFLFYALLIAYMTASGNILSHFFSSSLQLALAPYQATLFFVMLFGFFIFKGTKTVDHANRVMMFLKIGAFAILVLSAFKFFQPSLLFKTKDHSLISSIPILITAFGFHNMIPSLNAYLKGNLSKMKKVVFFGSLLSLFIYLIWQLLVLGIVPIDGPVSLTEAFQSGKEASETLSIYIKNPFISLLAQILGFFAILTSFLAQSLSLSHFLQDGLNIKSSPISQIGVCFLTLFPPLIMALFYPDLFYVALNFAGGICTVVLFGIIPSLMIWKGRYRSKVPKPTIVPGGKLLVLTVFIFSSAIFIREVYLLLNRFA